MSAVRVLVGTRKGAFVLKSDGKRERWDISGPHFAGWEIYHLKGSPVEREPAICVAVQRLVRADDPALSMTRASPGRRSATSSSTTASRALISGTTARSTPGSSSGRGISSRR